ncbi:MAG: hypothetical protein QM786_06050 [Breznakibacter sp.]
MNRGLLVLCVLFSVFARGNAQTFKFSEKHEEFVLQLKERFETLADKATAKEFLEQFNAFWMSSSLTPAHKDEIIATLNLINQKKGVPTPDYVAYLNAYRSFVMGSHPAESFRNWHAAIVDLIKKPRLALRSVNSLLDASRNQVDKGVVWSTPSVSWVSTRKDFKYIYDDNVLKLVLGQTNLNCYSANDSISIFDTDGYFVPAEETWYGTKGRLTWERSGFSADEVYATFGAYRVKMDKPYFTADSAMFYNKQFFNYPLVGGIDHKVNTITSPESTIYPKFTSYEQRFKINNIHPSMFYEGGFAQHGSKFLGAGTNENPATITVWRNDTLFVSARSLYFALRKDQIVSMDTEVKLHLDSGFIYHPGLMFKFMVKENELHLIRNGEGLAKSPYFDTYHNVSLDVELIKWKMGDWTIDFKMLAGAAENYAFFESLSYYREEFYNQLQGLDAVHPLQGLKDCERFYKGKPFTAKDYATFLRMPEGQVRQQIMALSFSGFVGYNVNTDYIEIREKLYDYLLFRMGKKDYDVIRFNSNTPGQVPNAQLDLHNYDLRLNGVENISVCDHQNIIFYPRNKSITLKQNRNFSFDGAVNAGMLNLYGDGFVFSYKDFRIDIKTIDSMRMQVQTGEFDYFGKPKLAFVNSTISQLSGYLQIDDPLNKSGVKVNPHYPVLTSTKESFVYYDRNDIQGGAYNRNNFYFQLDTFSLDGINSLAKQNFNFTGSFKSGIFPDFRDKLTVREDYSLGFKRNTPEAGYNIYGGNAKFSNVIDLSNRGLYGNGTLKYVTSTSLSENFLFLPDKTTGIAHNFTIDKQGKGAVFPDVKGRYVKIDYEPYSDQLMAKSQEEYFAMYNEEAQLNGELTLKPGGLNGNGTFYMRNGSLVSKDYAFSDRSLIADNSDFSLNAKDVEGVSFATNNLISTIDFDKRMGTFVSKSGGSKVDFTENRYVSFVKEFSWDIDRNYIFMGKKGSEGNRFVSVHKKQDSLDFMVPLARYDVALKLIEAEEVKSINVGDAVVKLKNGRVNIRENAVIDPLDSVTIVMNNGLHTFYDGHVVIEGKYAYNGSAKYDFVNAEQKKQTVQMDKFEMNGKHVTVAQGTVQEKDYFTFNKHFAYRGKVMLNASDTLLTFDGGAQLLHRCLNGPQAYIRFTAPVNPNKVMIPIGTELLDDSRQALYRDFFLKKDSTHVYSSFIEGRKNYSDVPIISGGGFLTYNEGFKAFEIASALKHQYPDTVGTKLSYSEIDCNVYGEGNLDMGIELEQVKYRASGSITHQRDKDVINLSTMFGLNFFFTDKLVEVMVADLKASEAKPAEISASTFRKRSAEWIGPQDARKLQELRTSAEPRELPKGAEFLFNFGNLDWTWNTATSSYRANGTADLVFVGKNAINKQVNVKAEIVRKRSGNSIDLYIEAGPETWFYFGYKATLMQILSSNAEFNSTVQLLKPEERKQKTKIGEKTFSFIMAPESKKNRFIKRIDAGANADPADEEDAEYDAADKPAAEENK